MNMHETLYCLNSTSRRANAVRFHVYNYPALTSTDSSCNNFSQKNETIQEWTAYKLKTMLHPVSWHKPEAATRVFKYSWGWKQKASETCRVLLQLLTVKFYWIGQILEDTNTLTFPSYGNQKVAKMGVCAIRQGLLGAFAKLRKTTVSFVISVCPSVPRPHGITRLTLDRFSWNLIFFFVGSLSR
jgi:hypothetical protein